MTHPSSVKHPKVARKIREAYRDAGVEQRKGDDDSQEHARRLFLFEIGQGHLREQRKLRLNDIPVYAAADLSRSDALALPFWIHLRM